MTSGTVFVLTLGTCCFASFSWAVGKHFRRGRRFPLEMRFISIASLLGFGWTAILISAKPSGRAWPFAPIALAAALALFWWAVLTTRRRRPALAFAGEAPTSLHTSGPYKYVRHPFYLSYILFWLAVSVPAAGIMHWSVAAVLSVAYVMAARREEREFARSPLAQGYAQYRQSTWMFMPYPAWPTKCRPARLRRVARRF